MKVKVLTPEDKDSILKLERSHLPEDEPSFLEWHASWREESLDHYLDKGWSYAVLNDSGISSYFLAQPILFLHGHMQSLWLEHLYFQSPEERDYLLDVAYRTAREKHLQKLLFSQQLVESHQLESHPLIKEQTNFYSTNTTKMT
tara:strand:+ start:6188 stop:6619 length:432 start_codon:yes stop_codon:yes gene_type:complete